jgi:hypothetical protein
MSLKPEEAVEFLKFVGIEADNLEAAKEAMNSAWVPKKHHDSALGALNGKFTTALTQLAKGVGIEVDKSEFKDKDTVEIPAIIGTKLQAKFTELEGQKSATASEVEAKYKSEIDKYKSKITDLEGLTASTAKQFEEFKTTVETEKRNGRISAEFGGVFSKLPFSQTVSEFTKKGFEASVRDKYRFDLSEDGTPVVRDAEGQAVKSKVNAGKFATYAEVIEAEFKSVKELQAVADPKKVTTFGGSGGVVPPVEPNGKSKAAQPFQQRYI